MIELPIAYSKPMLDFFNQKPQPKSIKKVKLKKSVPTYQPQLTCQDLQTYGMPELKKDSPTEKSPHALRHAVSYQSFVGQSKKARKVKSLKQHNPDLIHTISFGEPTGVKMH